MVFDDRVEVNSPGGLPPGVTLANIERKHVLRNPLIANYLFDIFYIEKWEAYNPLLFLPARSLSRSRMYSFCLPLP